jgi:hypothetical protein
MNVTSSNSVPGAVCGCRPKSRTRSCGMRRPESRWPAFGAVSLDTGQFVRMMCPIFNAATFRTFLRRLLRQQTPGRRMIVVLDNARLEFFDHFANRRAFCPGLKWHFVLVFVPHSDLISLIDNLKSRPVGKPHRHRCGMCIGRSQRQHRSLTRASQRRNDDVDISLWRQDSTEFGRFSRTD